jgi:hypothetical protein
MGLAQKGEVGFLSALPPGAAARHQSTSKVTPKITQPPTVKHMKSS